MVIFLLRYNVGNIDIIVFVIVTESERLREREILIFCYGKGLSS